MDSGNTAVLVLLDISAAFNTIDYNIPISRLGFQGTVLKWFKCYFINRSFSVALRECT